MSNIKKLDWYWRSGGAAQALSAPSFLQVNGWSESRVDALVMEKFGQDYNQFEISDDAGFSNIIEATGDITNNYYSFTGLTEETTYYVRGRAKFGSVYTDWIEQSCYTLSTPLHAYDFRGIDYDTTNIYGKTGSPNTASQVGEVYSYRGTANKLTNNGSVGSLIYRNNLSTFNNNESAYTTFSNVQYYKPDTAINLGTEEFTVLWEVQFNNLSASILKTFAAHSTDTDQFMQLHRTAAKLRFGSGVNPNYVALFPSSINPYALTRIMVKRTVSGSDGTITLGLMSTDDDTISWGTPITNTNLKDAPIFDRLFTNEYLSINSILNFYTKALTDDQIKREFKRAEQPSYTFKANDDSLIPTGVTWEDLDVNGYFYEDMVAGTTGGSSWNGIVTIGNQSCVRLVYRDALSSDFLKIYNHLTGKVSNNLDVGDIPGQFYDGHNVGSVFLADNTWYHLEMDNHYESVPTNIIVKRFGDNFNMTEITQLPIGNGIPSHRGSNIQYLNGIKTDTAVIILAQEFLTNARWLTAFVFKDNFNSCKKIRIIDIGSGITTHWFYQRVVYREGGTCSIIAQYLDNTVTANQRYVNSFLLLSDDDFSSVRNIGTSWSKTLLNGAPVTVAEATTNCLVGTDGTSKTYSRIVLSMFHDPDTSKYYGVETNGDLNGLNFLIDDGAGGWTIRAIDVLGEAVEFGYTVQDSVYHGQCVAQMVRTGASSYDLYAFVIVSGTYPNKIYKLVRFRTSDSWVTTDSVVDMTNDDTWCHQSLNITHNLHYSGGSTAYNGKKLLACSRVYYGEPTVYSDVKFMDIS